MYRCVSGVCVVKLSRVWPGFTCDAQDANTVVATQGFQQCTTP